MQIKSRLKNAAAKLATTVIGMLFITSCAVRPYSSQAQCKSDSGIECQQACQRMECTDFSANGCFTKGKGWDWFLDLKDSSAYHFKSDKTMHSLLMMKKNGDMYLIMNGNFNHIQPGYGLSPTIATPPKNHPYFHPDTYNALASEGFQCTSALSNTWIPKANLP